MGRRKERRLASISNAGRRVKLDLFAEPTGDSDGYNVQEEVGGNIESKQKNGLPNSPSSSGQQPQNPLLLLGQYSDDVDEEFSEDHEAAESSLSAHNSEVADPLIEESKDLDSSDDAKLAAPECNQEEIEVKALDVPEDVEVANIRAKTADIDVVEQASVPGTSDVSVIGDVSSDWKIVMHEESNNYYYWNTKTGETSWDIPDVLAQITQPFSNQSSFPVNDTISEQEHNLINGSLDADTTGRSVDVSTTGGCTGLVRNGSQMNGLGGDKTRAPESSTLPFTINQTESTSNSELTDACFGVTSSSGPSPAPAPAHFMQNMAVTEELKCGFNLSSQLICKSRSLLDRLGSLKGSDYPQGYDWTMKYIMEIRIRLSDYEALVPYETTLLPYWEHSERQLKRLESAINEEIYQMAILVQSDASTTDFTLEENGKLQSGLEFESEAERVKNGASTSEGPPNFVGILTLRQGDLANEAPDGHVSSFEAAKQLESGSQVNELVSGALSNDLPINYGSDSGEDVDMDVDMEVEDLDSAENRTIGVENGKESPGHPNPYAGHTSVVLDEGPLVPPPPDDEWIPPPPPDNEDIPPPPPDEPLEPSYALPPSYIQTAPVLYSEQITMQYPEANFEYYGLPVADVSNANFYANSDVALSHAPVYYAAVPNAYSNASVIPVEPEAYNSLQGGLIPNLPVSAVASQFPISDCVAFGNSAPDQTESTEIAKVNVDAFAVNEAEKAQGGRDTATIQAHPIVSMQDKDSVLPIKPISVAPATSTVSAGLAKNQSKGARSKRRAVAVAVAPSLRSNKKVSSLVDKWKAAKEELLEDEEEPETAYEMFERKRRREIEEWHSLQIASGEAKENANFLPLGGDWRERIKRRRAQSAKEAERSSPETRHDGNQQPDLIELSSNLPSGWQAYWDESSKKVYYANVLTSETSWSRPK